MDNLDLGHWTSTIEFENVNEWFGFVYRVTDLTNDMQYIGRKQFHHYTRKKVKGRKNRKRVVKESKWREYTTSSKRINVLIEEHGIARFSFEIIELCATRGDLSYREVEIQWSEKVLSALLPNGEPKFYNGNIGSVKFRLSKHSKKTREKMSASHKGLASAKKGVKITSKDTLKKMSDATKRQMTPEAKEHLSNINLGKKMDEATKEKISKANTGVPKTAEHVAKVSAALKGRVIPEDQKLKMSLAKNPRGCRVNGIEYNSIKEAANQLDKSIGYLTWRLNSDKYPEFIIIIK